MRTLVLAVLVLTACTGGSRLKMATGTVTSDQEVRAIMRRALESDASGQPADTLYTGGATIAANGRARLSAPRFAGIGRGGLLSIQALSAEMAPPFAWGTVRYQSAARDGSNAVTGVATFILQQGDQGWRIVHVHSSLAVPGEAIR